MKKKYFNILFLLSLAVLLLPAKSFAQRDQQTNLVTVESVVTDDTGNPVQATIYGNEGLVVTKTDASGKFTITVPIQTDLLIESDGYESRLFKSGEIQNLKAFQLTASEFKYGEKDDVNIAFGKVKSGNLVGAVSVMEPDKIIELHGKLYRKYEPVFNIPESRLGRAQFYSPYKKIGNYVIDTFWFNFIVIWVMSCLFYFTLLYNVLGRIVRYFELWRGR